MTGQKRRGSGRTPAFGIPKKPLDGPKVPTVHAGQVISGSTDHVAPSFSFLHLDSDAECPSAWNSDEMKSLFNTMKKASSMTWRQVKETGGHGRHAQGIAFKNISTKAATRKLPSNLAEDIDLSEMRVSDRARIFGVRNEATYYVIWLDRDHAVCPEGKQVGK